MSAIIYHNPKCSKSRKTLEILQNSGVEFTVIDYLQKPPSKEDLRGLLAKLGLRATDLIRSNEEIFSELNLADGSVDEDALISAMVANPILIERPIVVVGEKAVIGRPPENVLQLL